LETGLKGWKLSGSSTVPHSRALFD